METFPLQQRNAADPTETTLVAPALASDETLAAPEHLVPTSGAVPIASRPATTAAVRTTVLPRVEVIDAKPRVVTDGKRRFDPVRHLGAGGHGEVTGVLDNDIGREVAVKRLRAHGASPGLALRFAEEVRTVGQLKHPNIVPIHDVGVDENGDYYFVMKYVEGETLESVIEKLAAGDRDYHARYGYERRVQIFGAILEAVAFAHAKGIVHRDIKPANVMIGAYGEVVLMDWGIAKRRDRTAASEATPPTPGEAAARPSSGRRGALFETRIGEVIGTPAYMSPEQARGEPADERSDVYALSLLFHELLCLRHPLEEKTTVAAMLHAAQHEPVPHLAGISNPHQPPVPAELSWFVHQGVAKEPAKRYQSVVEMSERLARRAEGSFPIQCPITFSKRVLGFFRRFVDRHPILTTAILSVMVMSFVAALVTTVVVLVRAR